MRTAIWALLVLAMTHPLAPASAREFSVSEVLAAMAAGRSPLSASELEDAIRIAEKQPLGSRENPVRVARPEGQRAYLATLRCADAATPHYVRRGNVGMGVYMSIIDVYAVDCGNAAPGQVDIFMDMYHPGHVEHRPVPGFTVEALEPVPVTQSVTGAISG